MSDRLTPEREAEIAARAEAATEGPWEEYEGYGPHFYAYLRGPYMRGVGTLNFGEGDDAEADKALTLNAREDIRALLAELAAVRAERDQARAAVLRGLDILRIWRDERETGPEAAHLLYEVGAALTDEEAGR